MSGVILSQDFWEQQYQALFYQFSIPNGRFNWEGPLGSAVTVSYRFAETYPAYSGFLSNPAKQFSPIPDNYRHLFIDVMKQLSEFTKLTFVEDLTSKEGDIDVMILGGNGFLAQGYQPMNGQVPQTGDLLMPADANPMTYDPTGDGSFLGYRDLLLHELGHAIGLAHPIDYGFGSPSHPSDYSIIMDPTLVNQTYTVMAYAPPLGDPVHDAATFMPLDILALQHLYGVNRTATAGNNKYDLQWNQGGVRTLWDYAGVDILDLSAMKADGSIIDLRIGGLSSFGVRQDVSYYQIQKNINNMIVGPNTIIERAIGSAFDDVIIGHDQGVTLLGADGDDQLVGGTGDDILQGGPGDDVLQPSGGRDVVDGGEGQDLVQLNGEAIGFISLTAGENVFVIGRHETYQIRWVEQFAFSDTVIRVDELSSVTLSFNAKRYIASYTDLAEAYGTDTNSAAQHFAYAGFAEGRNPLLFDTSRYIASHPDLITAFGSNEDAALQHYLAFGRGEARSTYGFNGLQYVASYIDLAIGFGTDIDAATQHYIAFGFSEGRSADNFDGLRYIASNSDLIETLGSDDDAAAAHYIAHGRGEDRIVDSFDGLQYLASYDDLAIAFGIDIGAATQHYIGFGFAEGRPADRFDGLRYIASYSDLIEAFGSDDDAAALHYILAGRAEGRDQGLFDALAYSAANPDLNEAFGLNIGALTKHYIDHGFFEGRPTNPETNFILIG